MTISRLVAATNEPVETSSDGTVDSGKSARPLSQDDVIHRARTVLTYCLPGKLLPTDLSRLRAMLDAQMFGRNQRELRDDAVRVAWQIDSWRASQAR